MAVVVSGVKSSDRAVGSGVPQGSVLGPALFLIYVSRFPDIVKNFSSLFADSTKLFTYMLQLHDEVPSAAEDATNLHTPGSLQADINSLTYWSESFQMSFNLDKCHILHLGKNNPKASYTMYKTSSIRSTTSAISYYLTFHQLTPVDTETDL